MDFDFDFTKDEKRRKRKRFARKTIIFISQVIGVIALAYLLTEFAVERTTMPGDSMLSTLNNEDSLIIDKFSYLFSDPERYDIIVFKLTGKEHSFYSIKRVIGLPGEKIQIKGGYVYINDVLLDEPMIVEPILIEGLAKEAIMLDDDEYFVLGDNRNMSEDSRFANVGNITKNDIVGRAWLRTNEFDFVGKINMNGKKNEQKTDEQDVEK